MIAQKEGATTVLKKIQIMVAIIAGLSGNAFCATDDDTSVSQNDNETNVEQGDIPASKPDQNDQLSAANSDAADKTDQDDPKLVKAVEDALSAVKKNAPSVNEDALRVWKNFKGTSKPVNYTYRSWGRQIIMWLKEEKKMVFHNVKQVGNVFTVIYNKGLISQNAVMTLSVDVWGYLVHLEGSPDWEKRNENRMPGGEVVLNGKNTKKPEMPV
jgi:hypothetical protein